MPRQNSSHSSSRRYGEAASKSVERAMHREKAGTLKSGKGGVVHGSGPPVSGGGMGFAQLTGAVLAADLDGVAADGHGEGLGVELAVAGGAGPGWHVGVSLVAGGRRGEVWTTPC